MLESRIKMIEIAKSLIGTPYLWGGDDPKTGLDCSGFVLYLLKQMEIVPQNYDDTAKGIFNHFKARRQIVDRPCEACLVFYAQPNSTHINHIELCIDKEHSIGARGGNQNTTTVEIAIAKNANVRQGNIIQGGRVIIGFADPFKAV